MNPYAIFAIYFLFWVISAFLVLPFGLRTPHESGVRPTVGHADSAPVNFRPGIVCLRATILATILFVLYYSNYIYGWVTLDSLGIMADAGRQ